MRPTFLLGFALLVACQGFAQFAKKARETFDMHDSLVHPKTEEPTTEKVNIFSDSTETLYSLVDYVIGETERARRDTFQQSQLLMQMTGLANDYWSALDESSNRRWRKVRKQVYRGFYGSKARFGMIEIYSFTIPLANTPGDFYYDKEGPDGGFNLYKGKKKIKPTKENPEPKAEPVKLYSEKELADLITKKLRQSGASRQLASGLISYYGYSVKINKRTINRKKTPTAQVVVILGARRMKMVKVKKVKQVKEKT